VLQTALGFTRFLPSASAKRKAPAGEDGAHIGHGPWSQKKRKGRRSVFPSAVLGEGRRTAFRGRRILQSQGARAAPAGQDRKRSNQPRPSADDGRPILLVCWMDRSSGAHARATIPRVKEKPRREGGAEWGNRNRRLYCGRPCGRCGVCYTRSELFTLAGGRARRVLVYNCSSSLRGTPSKVSNAIAAMNQPFAMACGLGLSRAC
jgi:hypothetical protein